MSETATATQAPAINTPINVGRTGGGGAVLMLVLAGLLAHAIALLTVFLLQGETPRLLVWEVSQPILMGFLGASFALAIVHAFVPRAMIFVGSLAVLALLAAGIRDVQGTDWELAVLLFTFLLATELPLGSDRLRDLRAGIPASAGKQARRDLNRYTVHYLLFAPLLLLGIAGLTVLALSLPDLLLGGFSAKYEEALETRSVFFVVAMTWIIVAPLLAIRAIIGLRLRMRHPEPSRPESPITTGASLLDEKSAEADNTPLIEVTE